jgi:hypothetical protein
MRSRVAPPTPPGKPGRAGIGAACESTSHGVSLTNFVDVWLDMAETTRLLSVAAARQLDNVREVSPALIIC